MNHTKHIFTILLLFCNSLILITPNNSFAQSEDNSISPFAISVNPLGFVQFGPIINIEFGFPNNLVFNLHTRFPSLGVLTYVALDDRDGIDDLSGSAFGGGLLYFIGHGKSKPYVGGHLEYHSIDILYAQGEQYEWSKTEHAVIFIVNGGYRFRFGGGFFINTGAYLGFSFSSYDWEYTDPSYGIYDTSSRSGNDTTPFGMLETTFGFEF